MSSAAFEAMAGSSAACLLAFQFGFGFENQLLHAVPFQPIEVGQSFLGLPSTGSLARGRYLFKFGSQLSALLCLLPLVVVGKQFCLPPAIEGQDYRGYPVEQKAIVRY